MIYKTLHRKLKTAQDEPHKKTLNSCTAEGQVHVVPAPPEILTGTTRSEIYTPYACAARMLLHINENNPHGPFLVVCQGMKQT
jgi:hypothetical protein